jgi:hypothetical protein
MKDLFGNEVTMEEARVMARRHPPTDRRSLVILRTARGLHPHSGLPLRQPPGETCGSCSHHYTKKFANAYHKCDFTPDSFGAATDIRVRWPACVKWEPEE